MTRSKGMLAILAMMSCTQALPQGLSLVGPGPLFPEATYIPPRDPGSDIRRTLGLFIKPGLEFAPGLRVYARLGRVESRLDPIALGGVPASGRWSGLGLGLSYRLAGQATLSADYLPPAEGYAIGTEGAAVRLSLRF